MSSTNIEQRLNAPLSITTSIVMGVAAILMFLLLPLFVGAAANTLQLEGQQLSFFASSDLLGFGIGSFAAIWWTNRVDWKWSTIVMLLLVLSTNILSVYVFENINQLLTLRLLSGIGQGSLLSLYSMHISQTKTPEKYYSYFLAAQTIAGALGLWLLPGFIENIGASAVLYAQCILVIIAIIMVFVWMPRKGLHIANQDTTSTQNFILSLLGLLGLLLFFIAQGGVWAFMERIGNSLNLEASFVGMSLSLGMVGAFFGSISASFVDLKFGRRLPLLIVAICQPLTLLLVFSDLGNSSFLVGTMLFTFFWNFGLPYMIGILIGIDPSGKTVVGANPVFALGVAIAPIILAFFITNTNFTPILYLAAVAVILSVVLFISLLNKIK